MGVFSKTIGLSLSRFAESLSILTGTVLLSVGMNFRSSAPALIQWHIWTISTAFPASLSHLYLEALYYTELPFINQPVLLAIILQRVYMSPEGRKQFTSPGFPGSPLIREDAFELSAL